jgi:SAM-dependent methyltransferase
VSSNYFIKPEYKARTTSATLDAADTDESYWTETRIQLSSQYQRYVYQLAAAYIQQNAYTSFLDLGSGPGTKVAQLIRPVCSHMVLVDQASVAVHVRRILPEASFIAANLEEINMDLGELFDLIICADVIEHLVEPNHSVDFIHSHLAPHGLAIISTPERDYLRGEDSLHSPKEEHVREWNAVELRQYLESRGFAVQEQLYFPQRPLPDFVLTKWLSPALWQSVPWLRKRWGTTQVAVCHKS